MSTETTLASVPPPAQLVPSAETAAHVLAEQAKAVVQARYLVAAGRPRDWDQVRQALLRECDRSSFAEAAMYRKPIGGAAVSGLSIRFAEAALRIMGNVLPEAQVIYDDSEKRIVRVTVTDLEANLTYSKDILLGKTVERSGVKEGQEVLGARTNSYGKPVFIVRATEDDLAIKEAAALSKTIRQNGLRLIPGDLLDECEARIKETAAKRARADPDAERKRIVDAFGALGVRAAALKAYAGAALEALSPEELAGLREVYQGIKQGETNWSDVMGARQKTRGEPSDNAAGGTVAKIAEDLSRRARKPAKAEAAPSGLDLGYSPSGEHLDEG